jgi:hypothetical protein
MISAFGIEHTVIEDRQINKGLSPANMAALGRVARSKDQSMSWANRGVSYAQAKRGTRMTGLPGGHMHANAQAGMRGPLKAPGEFMAVIRNKTEAKATGALASQKPRRLP